MSTLGGEPAAIGSGIRSARGALRESGAARVEAAAAAS